MNAGERSRTQLVDVLQQHLASHHGHVLDAIEGLTEDQLDRSAAPSGWSVRQLVSHLLFDVEILWMGAVLGGDPEAIDRITDGWNAPPMSGEQLRRDYRSAALAGEEHLRGADLLAPPVWWPSREDFGGPRLGCQLDVVMRAIGETATHAGHLDLARERIDGRQHLVIG